LLYWIQSYLAVGPRPELQSAIGEGPTWESLKASGITRIIDLTDNDLERRYASKYKISYKCAKVRDHPEPLELLTVFQNVHEWIEEERSADGKVYLHCYGGNGRSPTCAMAHLMAEGRPKQDAEKMVRNAHRPTWENENIDNMRRALALWELQLDEKTMDLFLDHQSLGLRPFLEGTGRKVRDVTEISGDKDTSKSILDDKVIDHLRRNPELLLITKDTGLALNCESQNLSGQLMYIDETEAVAKEVIRRLSLKKSGDL